MLETLKAIILDFLDLPLEVGVSRRVEIESVSGKATICVGVRRSGKSTYMLQIIQSLLDTGVSRENFLYLNFFDDRLYGLQHEKLSIILEAYFSLYPEKKNKEKIYIFFDEMQMLQGWEPFVDRLLRTEKCEIYITGSSAQMLSKEIATQMRGRSLAWEMFPFSFREFLDYKDIKVEERLSTKKRLTIQKEFEVFWETGGFPEVVGLDEKLRIKIHQEYFQAILFRDLVERHNIAHPKALTDLAHKLIDSPASLYSINSLTGYLQSLGHKAPKAVVSQYVDWLEDAYFLFTVRLYDASISRSKAAPKKIYCIDHAFVKSISSRILVNSGHLLENLVFTVLRRESPLLYYYKTKSNKEVDFIIKMPSKKYHLIQVCESIGNDETKKREVSALVDAMAELKLNSSIIITRAEEEVLNIEGKEIKVMPAWRFALEPNLV